MTQRKGTGKGKARAQPEPHDDSDSGETFDSVSNTSSRSGTEGNQPTKAPTAARGVRAVRGATTAAPVVVAQAVPVAESSRQSKLGITCAIRVLTLLTSLLQTQLRPQQMRRGLIYCHHSYPQRGLGQVAREMPRIPVIFI